MSWQLHGPGLLLTAAHIMLIDGRSITSDVHLSSDVCLVGCGLAGLTLASEMIDTRLGVIALESGLIGCDALAQDRNHGDVRGDPYVGLRPSRCRQVGGTINIWNTPVRDGLGAKYVPLDARDFKEPGDNAPGWPLSHEDLLPYYVRAQSVCRLGPFEYSAYQWQTSRCKPLDLAVGTLQSHVYQFGSRDVFLKSKTDAIIGAASIRVVAGATVCAMSPGSDGTVKHIRAVTSAGATIKVSARIFVLSAGAIENARLLLVSRRVDSAFLGPSNYWIGRCFMEHPRDSALVLIPHSEELYADAAFYDAHDTHEGVVVCGRLGPSDSLAAETGLPNFSVSLQPMSRYGYLHRAMQQLGWRPRALGYGWSQLRNPARVLNGLRLLINLEQRPVRDNRIVLSSSEDDLGVPRPALCWTWKATTESALREIRDVLKVALESSGLGQVRMSGDRVPDANAHHHAGTTRMALVPEDGVLDTDSRAHGSDNLYVTGASVFPTAGYANPALTIVALALRLSDHLKSRL